MTELASRETVRPVNLHQFDTQTTPLDNFGEVFTKEWVVKLILDLAGYVPTIDLASRIAIEPACGEGAFLIPMTKRVSESCRIHGWDIAQAGTAILAVELQQTNVDRARESVIRALTLDGWAKRKATAIAHEWISKQDFLLDAQAGDGADFVIGNPPYVRLEEIPKDVSDAYRAACPTMGGRADLFVGFIEKGLKSLKPGGTLAFICADRWMKNAYGSLLRSFVSSSFSVDAVLSMHDVDAFEDDVSAYPAIIVIRNKPQGRAIVADTNGQFGQVQSEEFVKWALSDNPRSKQSRTFSAASLKHWYQGKQSWPSGNPARLQIVADLEDRFPPLQDDRGATRVGIGVATGSDQVFVTENPELVEPERLLPLAMVRDVSSGIFEWSGHYLVDPWEGRQGLVNLAEYRRLEEYFEQNEAALRGRNVAERRPRDWYRTIDRVDHSLTDRPKLLFPDMKLRMSPVLEEGGFYPHHNLYYVVSDDWPLNVLGGLLMSSTAELFVKTYAVKMRGGTLRFQAQYLRRIHIPPLASISKRQRIELSRAFELRDRELASSVAAIVYGLDSDALRVIDRD